MVVISKELYYKTFPLPVKCTDIIHRNNPSCLKANLDMARSLLFGVTKFVVPCTLVKLGINYNKIDKNYLKELLISHLRTTINGVSTGVLIILVNCLASNIFGTLHYYSVCVLSGFLSGLSLLVETEHNKVFNTIVYFNMVVQAAFNNLRFFNIIELTKMRQTVMFMFCSSLLMYMLQNRKEKINFTHFWFYTPPRKKILNSTEEDNACYHKENCEKYALEAALKYSVIGYLANIFKLVFPRMGQIIKDPKLVFSLLFHKSNVKFGIFMGGFVSLYRYISCSLLRRDQKQKSFHAAIAGLISGATYIIEPNLQMLIIAITTILQILYQKIKRRYSIFDSMVPLHILYSSCNAILFHNRMTCLKTCPAFYKNVLSIATEGRLDNIYNHITSIFF